MCAGSLPLSLTRGIAIRDQYLWDYRVPAAADYVVSSIVKSLSDPAVDGTYTDDIFNYQPDQLEATTAILKMQNATNMTNTQLQDLRTYRSVPRALARVLLTSMRTVDLHHTVCL